MALREAFSSALAGKSRERADLVTEKLSLSAKVPAVVARGGAPVVERLFTPLGYAVRVSTHPLDATFPDWGDASLLSLEIEGKQTVHDLLSHLYVLLPVLDAEKHYFVGEAEVEKLLGHGEGWLSNHPEKLLISNRYLKYRRDLVRDALSQLTVDLAEADEEAQVAEDALEERVNLADQRMEAVLSALRSGEPPIRRVIDLGCGEGRLLRSLIDDRAFTEIVGVDVSPDALTKAERRLKLDRLPAPVRARVKLIQGSALYRDQRLEGFDAIALVEVIEHVEEDRLDVLTKVVFGHLKPRRVVVTTPNAEYNVMFPTLGAGKMRHRDHRFEWSRAQFRSWCEQSAAAYAVRYADIGPADQAVGAPTKWRSSIGGTDD